MQINVRKKTLRLSLIALTFICTLFTLGIILMNTQQKPTIIDASARIGTVTLNVRDLETVKNFYKDVVLLNILSESNSEVLFGKGEHEVVRLVESELPENQQNEAGLYHVAIVFGSRGELAYHLNNVLEKSLDTYQGSGDHTVSEAFYFADPEGNGIEIYFDRPKSEWMYDANGRIQMGTQYIDEQAYIKKYLNKEADDSIKTGHIHLQIGDIRDALDFYVDGLGFEVQAQMPTALFISAGGYHHHIGLNTWNSLGAGKREETLGLRSFEILIDDLSGVESRLSTKKIEYIKDGNSITVNDPWNNQIRILKI